MKVLNKDKKSVSRHIVKRRNLKRVAIAILLALIGLVVYIYAYQYTYQEKQRKQLEYTLQEKIQLQKELDKKQLDSQETQKQIEQLKKELQAKRDNQARALAEAEEQKRAAVTRIQATVAVSGSCAEWLVAAGVTDIVNASELIRRESGCNPNAVNRSSGACGIAQELPCGKSGCGLGNPVCQIKWMQSYVVARYGSWAGAVAFHSSHNWY